MVCKTFINGLKTSIQGYMLNVKWFTAFFVFIFSILLLLIAEMRFLMSDS